jgi:hypothetical protein
MLGFAYLPLDSSWICPPAVFESLAALMRPLMDLRFYPPLLVSLRLHWCLSWSWVERLLLSDTSSWVYMPRVLSFHFSKSFMFYMEVSNGCFIACFDWVDTLRSGCPHVGVGKCWIWCLCTIEAVRVVGVWVRFGTDGGLGLLASLRDIWCPWVVGVRCGTSLFCIPAVEALHGEGVGWVDGGWMSLCGLGTLSFIRCWRWSLVRPLFVFIGALHGGGDGWVVGQLLSLLGLCAQGSRNRWWRWARFGMLLFVPLSCLPWSRVASVLGILLHQGFIRATIWLTLPGLGRYVRVECTWIVWATSTDARLITRSVGIVNVGVSRVLVVRVVLITVVWIRIVSVQVVDVGVSRVLVVWVVLILAYKHTLLDR